MIPIKTEEEIMIMQEGGRILSRIIKNLKRFIKKGISTYQIDEFASELMAKEKVVSAFKGYRGFPANICTSVNEEVVHGIPLKEKILKEGDIISVDVGIIYKDFYLDTAFTIPIGRIKPQIKKLISVTYKALFEGIKKAKPNNYLTDISHSIQSFVERHGFSVVRQFVGHGIGRLMHEEPEIPNFGRAGGGPILKKGMVLAIEPMVNIGTYEVEIAPNGWTAITKDRLYSAHFEHTVAITDGRPIILTI
ncbi:MAG: type I methionyl aminopeptidase [Candidatus Omnitrophica bacterium]|nr:type I methionyl aminopeptidase [Candidatus Omnitrophota bacterium]